MVRALDKRESERKLATALRTLEALARPTDGINDLVGDYSDMLSRSLAAAAVFSWLARGDVHAYKSFLKRSTDTFAQLMARGSTGDPVERSYIDGKTHRLLLHSWAAGVGRTKDDVGGDWDVFLDESECHPFEIAISRALVAVLDNQPGAHDAISALRVTCRTSARNYLGNATVLRGILDSNELEVSRGIDEMVAGHDRESRPGGDYAFLPESYLHLSGIGIARFAKSRGISVKPRPPTIPGELLA